ncbi:unnamed protein product [Amoebophrya sp. A120]|nr:unnamed protein product [Amoebophrya sp. A120]|eukprot:GSA120T00004623001.1
MQDHIQTHEDLGFCRWVQDPSTSRWRPAEQFIYPGSAGVILPKGKKKYIPPPARALVTTKALECRKCGEEVCKWNTRMNPHKRGGAMRRFNNHYKSCKGRGEPTVRKKGGKRQ